MAKRAAAHQPRGRGTDQTGRQGGGGEVVLGAALEPAPAIVGSRVCPR